MALVGLMKNQVGIGSESLLPGHAHRGNPGVQFVSNIEVCSVQSTGQSSFVLPAQCFKVRGLG